ncbi:MAG: hypothetical protein ABII93_03795 [Chrysiogenia bacterium]
MSRLEAAYDRLVQRITAIRKRLAWAIAGFYAVFKIIGSILVIPKIRLQLFDTQIPFKDKINEIVWLAIVIGIIFFIIFVDKILKSKVIKKLILFLLNPFSLLFGNIYRDGLLEDIHKMTMALQETELFGRLAGLENSNISDYFILFTHKQHDDPGDYEGYKMPGFPNDEAEIIMKINTWVAHNLMIDWRKVKPRCSCSYKNDKLNNIIQKTSSSIIGSAKENMICKKVMDNLKILETTNRITRMHGFLIDYFEAPAEDNKKVAYLKYVHDSDNPVDQYTALTYDQVMQQEAIKNLIPMSTFQKQQGDRLIDYAVIMKLPNIFAIDPGPGEQVKIDQGKTLLLFSGCKAAGQVAITDWIFTRENLIRLIKKYPSKYFQVCLRIPYIYQTQSLPRIERNEITIMFDEEIQIG